MRPFISSFLRSLILPFFCFSVLTFFSSLVIVDVAHANIVLKVIAINPSKDQTQKAPVKAYLPKEVKADNVVDKGDLDIAYDTQQGSFYVYGEYELKPGQVLEKEIEIQDIWLIPEKDIDTLRADAEKLSGLMKNTDFGERAEFIRKGVEAKLDEIMERQRNAPANPEQHISEYRVNLSMLDEVKRDLALARSMLSQVKPLPTAVIWRLIIGIIIFLGLLGGAFYLIWQKQLRTITQEDTFFVPKEEGGGGVEVSEGQSVRESENGKKTQADEAEKALNKERKEEA